MNIHYMYIIYKAIRIWPVGEFPNAPFTPLAAPLIHKNSYGEKVAMLCKLA